MYKSAERVDKITFAHKKHQTIKGLAIGDTFVLSNVNNPDGGAIQTVWRKSEEGIVNILNGKNDGGWCSGNDDECTKIIKVRIKEIIVEAV